jgi:hypothetical protein
MKYVPTDAEGINPMEPEITEASSVKISPINSPLLKHHKNWAIALIASGINKFITYRNFWILFSIACTVSPQARGF